GSRKCARMVHSPAKAIATDKHSPLGEENMAGNGMTRRALLGNFAMLGIATGPGKVLAREHKSAPVHQDFSNSYLELIRLLREAAEIEHDLMIQYLYCAFSLKPAYA